MFKNFRAVKEMFTKAFSLHEKAYKRTENYKSEGKKKDDEDK